MFLPCDHCLRKHATHIAYSRAGGKAERLQLCGECYRKFRADSIDIPTSLPHPRWTEEEIANGLQAALIPEMFPKIPGYDISAFFRPARQVGGDYYDFFEIDRDHQGLLVADVSGKGIPATIVMTETKALLKSEAVRNLSPAQALHRVNRALYKDIKRGMFVTMYYAVLETRRSTLTCASAGHNPMVLWRKESKSCQLINPNGLALGIEKGPLFEKLLQENTVQLSQGNRFTLYTDGVTESMNLEKKQFGQNRLYLLINQLSDRSSSEFLTRLTFEMDVHQGKASQDDDVTIVTGRAV